LHKHRRGFLHQRFQHPISPIQGTQGICRKALRRCAISGGKVIKRTAAQQFGQQSPFGRDLLQHVMRCASRRQAGLGHVNALV